jgi:hypothetical protein
MSTMMKGVLCLGLLAMATQVQAGEPIPKDSGFSGFVQLGAGVMSMESNMVAGSSSTGDLGSRTISSMYESPDSETETSVVINGELRYTFGESGTQVFFGNSLEDLVRYDFTSQIGVRQDVGRVGIVGGGLLFTSFPTEVWEDPYMTNTRRQKTDRSAQGVRLTWENIMSSKFDVRYSYRDISIDDEYSGLTELPGAVNAYNRSLLDREGDQVNLTGEYTFVLNDKNLLKPSLSITVDDLDGGAMASDTVGLQLTHTYLGERYVFISNVYIASEESDKRNPIFNKTQESDTLGVGFIAMYKNFMDVAGLSLVGNIAYYDVDSNIAFYDANIVTSSVSCLYRF